MEDKLKPLGLVKEQDLIAFIINLFGILQNEASDKEITITGNQITIRKREAEEINKLNADTKDLEKKIFSWLHDQTPVLYLDENESALLRHLIYAAYYFTTEKAEGSMRDKHFLKYYKYLKSNKFI